ncbi:MAG: hypothetical protein ACWA41_00420 [Putridiphycobacter sp.]
MKKGLLTLLVIGAWLSACTKVEKQAPNNFVRQNVWEIMSLTIGGDEIPSHPTWDLSTEESGVAIWQHAGGTHARFYWSFSPNYNAFEFHVDQSPENKVNQAFKQCDNLSGKYKVLTNKKGLFEFESYETKGYVGPRVYLKME